MSDEGTTCKLQDDVVLKQITNSIMVIKKDAIKSILFKENLIKEMDIQIFN